MDSTVALFWAVRCYGADRIRALSVDVRRCVAKGGGGATMRARPKFDEWSLNVTVEYDERVISRADLLSAINDAGRFAGLGEYRPSSPKGGQFGRYAFEK